MKSKFRTLMANLVQLWTILCLASCATTPMTIPKEIDIAATEVSDKIPLKVGLYLSQNVRNAKYLSHVRQIEGGSFSAGDTLCYGSEKIMKNIFRETTILDSSDVLSAKSCDVIVSPEVITLDIECYGKFLKGNTCAVQTVIKWNIVSPGGKEIYTSTVKGDDTNIYVRSGIRMWQQFIEMSIKNSFQKAQEDIYTSVWWKKQWWEKSN